jgi:nucleoid-associated protein YgaU
MNCPVCGRPEVGSVCPRCGTDLSALLCLEEFPDVYYNRAVRLIAQDQLDEAKHMLGTALGLDPTHVDSYVLLGKACAETGMYAEAIAHWDEALRLGVEAPEAVREDVRRATALREEAEARYSSEEPVAKQAWRTARWGWIAGSVAAAVAALLIGQWVPDRPSRLQPAPATTATPVAESTVEPTLTPSKPALVAPTVEELLQAQGITDLQVDESDGVVYLMGQVLSPYDKYRIEQMARGTEGVHALDVSGVEVLYPESHYYTVRPGDCLRWIAERFYGDSESYIGIYEVNRDQIDDPSLILPGQVLLIP